MNWFTRDNTFSIFSDRNYFNAHVINQEWKIFKSKDDYKGVIGNQYY